MLQLLVTSVPSQAIFAAAAGRADEPAVSALTNKLVLQQAHPKVCRVRF
jgi:hypothetical protein